MAPSGWLRGPVWDTACLSFCWVPLYLWFVFGLQLGDGGGIVVLFGQPHEALALAILVVLALTFVHRHYTFVMVYGDPQAFSARARGYIIAPVVIFAVLLAARASEGAIIATSVVRVTGWELVLITSGTWNVWHTIQQRYGILRIYAGKAGAGLEARSEALRDRLLLWSLVVLVALALLLLRTGTFAGHVQAQETLRLLEPLTSAPAFLALAAALAALSLVVVIRWIAAERRALLTPAQRAPRLVFIGSTVLLFAVFVVHGPVVGYLSFGAAHAIEYIAFVHHFGERKYQSRAERNVAAYLLSRPLVFAPLLVSGLGIVYFRLQGYADTDTYLTYYVGTSMLHFLYDGWIWKVRRPEVADPLGARPSLAS